LTVRIIKSFEFRTAKALVLKDVNLVELTVGALMEKCREGEWPCDLIRWVQGCWGWEAWRKGRVASKAAVMLEM